MKVMVTGCSGFIAQHLMRACMESDWEMIGIDKRPLNGYHPHKFIQADVRDLNFRDMLGIDYVFHLAWRTNIPDCSRHPVESTKDNIDMSLHLLEICKEAGVKKFLFPSTASLYGHNPTPWKEDMPPEPIEHYSWQKLAIEEACQMYAKNGLPTTIFRFFQVFGEYQREDTALAAFLRSKQDGKPVTLTKTTAQSVFKSGQRDFVYAGDVAKALILAAEKDPGTGEIYNVGGTVHTMEEIAAAIGNEVTWIERRPYEVDRHESNSSKLKALGWSPDVDVIKWLKI